MSEKLECPHCKTVFVKDRANKLYCSRKCQQYGYNRGRRIGLDIWRARAEDYVQRMGERKYG